METIPPGGIAMLQTSSIEHGTTKEGNQNDQNDQNDFRILFDNLIYP